MREIECCCCFLYRCGSDAVIGIRSSSKTWYDLLIINGKHSIRMTFVFFFFYYLRIFAIIYSEQSQEAITNDTLVFDKNLSPYGSSFDLVSVILHPYGYRLKSMGVRIISGRTLDFFQRLPR